MSSQAALIVISFKEGIRFPKQRQHPHKSKATEGLETMINMFLAHG